MQTNVFNKVKFEELRLGDFIEFSNKYSQYLGGTIKGVIVQKTKYGIILNIDSYIYVEPDLAQNIGCLYFGHKPENTYWRLNDPRIRLINVLGELMFERPSWKESILIDITYDYITRGKRPTTTSGIILAANDNLLRLGTNPSRPKRFIAIRLADILKVEKISYVKGKKEAEEIWNAESII